MSPARTPDAGGKFPTALDEATGRLLISSGTSTYVLHPDGSALALEDAEPFTSKATPYKRGRACSNFKASKICGAPERCVLPGKPGKYGEVSLTFHGGPSAPAAKVATFYKPALLRSGREGYCIDTFDEGGAVLVVHMKSPQDKTSSLLSMVRGDGSEAWTVPLESFGKGAGLDLAVNTKDAVRLYGSILGDAAPIGGDFGYVATIDRATGALLTSAVIRN